MRALTFSGDGTLKLQERPAPSLTAPDDVLVDVIQTGICGTDRSVLVGKFPAATNVIMGHEGVGRVATTGTAVSHLGVGDPIVINPTLYCGQCSACQLGSMNHCRNKQGTEVGIDRDGCFADQIVLPAAFVHPIPLGMSLDQATLVEPLTCALNNVLAAGLEAGDSLTVLGGGPVGAVVASVASFLGHPTTISEADPTRRGLLADRLPSIGGGPIDVLTPAEVLDVAPAAAVIDTVGTLLPTAMDLVASHGCVVVMGYNSHASAQLRPLEILQRGLRIVGAGDYNAPLFPRALAIASHLPLAELITHRFPLEQHADALELLAPTGDRYQALKVVLQSEISS